MNEIYFQGFWRMDWGFGNPNKTATLIAILMVAVWSFTCFRKWGFWLSLILFSVLGVCLVHTFSRGGIIAALMGMAPLILFAPKPWPRKRIVAVILSLCVIGGASIYLKAHERYGKSVVQEDRSISNRFDIWKAVPAMMVDAPGGWGLGKSGKAFMDWYQPLDRSEAYRTLVNSHLTWLVEFGWLGRFLYIAGWLTVLVLCMPGPRWFAVPFGIWLALFTGAFFSSVAESPWLWIIPSVALLCVLVSRIRHRIWPSLKLLAIPPAFAAVLLLLVVLLSPRSSFSKHGNAIITGNSLPEVWLVADKKVLGDLFARSFRAAILTQPELQCGLVENIQDLPSQGLSSIILAGNGGAKSPEEIQQRLQSAKSITLINPNFFPEELSLPKEISLRVIMGEFSQSPSASAWSTMKNVERWIGVGDFIPNAASKLLGMP